MDRCRPDPESLVQALSDRLASRRPTEPAYRFVTQLAYGRHRGPAPPDARPAAVAILLYPSGGQWHTPFTLRPRTLTAHAGQISLPGGAVDSGESEEACALRELTEEIGVTPSEVRVAGRLSPVYVFRTGFRVQPFVLVAPETPQFDPNPDEVEQLLEVPLAHLFDQGQFSSLWITRQFLRFQAPCICFHHHRIWGATAQIIGDFLTQARGLW